MLKSPESIQRQLSDAISAIGREDFPAKWPSLMADLVDKFKSGELIICLLILNIHYGVLL